MIFYLTEPKSHVCCKEQSYLISPFPQLPGQLLQVSCSTHHEGAGINMLVSEAPAQRTRGNYRLLHISGNVR